MLKIMIIEDDFAIQSELSLLLENEGYQAIPVTDFADVIRQIKENNPALILLDLLLPGRDGWALCADIRRLADIPIIFITSQDSTVNELRALSLGGDDYITKPYNVPVLLARIKTVLRRAGKTSETTILKTGGLELDLAKGAMSFAGQTADLTRNELKILAHLMSHSGEIVSRADLIEVLWNCEIYIDDNSLSVNITRLRAKLDCLGLPGFIKTRRGMGYQL